MMWTRRKWGDWLGERLWRVGGGEWVIDCDLFLLPLLSGVSFLYGALSAVPQGCGEDGLRGSWVGGWMMSSSSSSLSSFLLS